MKVIALFFTFITATLFVQAQSEKALFKKYEYGKSLLNNKQYTQAYEVFKSLSAIELGNRYRNHALYLYALTAYQTEKESVSRNALFELLRKAPNWEHKDEVYYLLGTIDMENRNFPSALENFNNIKSEEFEEKIIIQLDKYLVNVGVDDLEFLYRKYDYELIGVRLYDALQKVNIYPDYEMLYEELLPIYGSTSEETDSLNVDEIVYKEAYNVAVLLPFMYEDFDSDSIPSNQQRVFDLYQGIKMAAKDLEEEGVSINVFAFDTKNDSIETRKILSDTAFAQMDLILGPLYPKTIALVGDYAGLFRKVMVNPVSDNELIINGNPFAFLTRATPKSEAETVVDYVLDSLDSKQAYIIYGLKKSEEDAAFHYGEYLQDRGGEVAMFRQFGFEKTFFQDLQDSLAPLTTDSIPHVFVSSEDPVVASNVISALLNLQANSRIFAPASWLNFNQFSFEQLEKMKVHFVYPRYYDTDGYYYRKFRSDYVKKMNLIPSLYACSGYETLYYFGKQLHEFGSGLYFKIHETGKVKGKIFKGIDYSKGNDNSFIPLLKFTEGQLEMVNSYFQTPDEILNITAEKDDK